MRRSMKLWALLVALVLLAAACGGDDDGEDGTTDEGGGDPEATIVHGTTDQPVSYDPAGSYDLPSWNVIYNVMEGLLTIPPGGSSPEPALAEFCDFEDGQTYTCTLREGVTFHDGSELDAEDVVTSFRRNIEINDPAGACSLLASLAECGKWKDDAITTEGNTVTFHLNAEDTTWPAVLTTGAAAITPSEYPADDLQKDDQAIGTGPYTIAEFRPGEQTVMEANPDYWGDAPANGRVIIQYFDKSSALKLAVEQGEVDVAYRSLTPTEVEDLRGAGDLEVVEGNGTEIRYLVFNTKFEPYDDVNVRRAIAAAIDRQAIVENVYNETVEPLYSMVPVGLPGHIDAFADEFGETADVDAATSLLEEAGVETPLELEIWWTPSHYGDASADEYTEIKRALEDSGLFTVRLKSTEWDQYSEAAFTDQYPAYQLGWFPDYPDPDNYLSPFYSSDSFLGIHYENKEVDDLLAEQRAETDPGAREAIFQQIQEIAAQDVPIVPIWQGQQVAITATGISGVEDTFDPSFQFRYWLIGKEG
jgi:peptide/nickel transport system substrate-binding protein